MTLDLRHNITFGLSRKALGSREYQRQRRERMRLHRICVFCRGPVERNRTGKTECAECRRVHNIQERTQ